MNVQLSKDFSLEEMCFSPTALTRDIPNVAAGDEVTCLVELVEHVLQPLRDLVGKPVIVTSGFRCTQLNRLIGGENGSQHTKGQAADIHVEGMSSMDLARLIVENLQFDQVIEEFGRWVHVSYKKHGNRGQFLQAHKAGGKTVYEVIA